MNDYMLEDIHPGQDVEPSWFEIHDGQLPPIAWEGLRVRLRQANRAEHLWESLFVVAAFSLMSWYMFWLYEALQNFTIVPLP